MPLTSFRPPQHMRQLRQSRHAVAQPSVRREAHGPPTCTITRRIVDDLDRPWNVREIPVAAPFGRRTVSLFFRCSVAGVRPEIRSSGRRLEMLSNDELVTTLLRGEE